MLVGNNVYKYVNDCFHVASLFSNYLCYSAKRGNSELTEDDFIQGTMEFLQGKGRRSYTLGEEDQDMKNFNELPFWKKV
jgi:hypothetical protein